MSVATRKIVETLENEAPEPKIEGPAATPAEPGPLDEIDVAAAPAETALTPEQVQELKAKAAKADEHWDRLLRTTAEFDNFRKRSARERQDAVKFANETLLQKLLPVLDSFDMALTSADNTSSVDALKSGITMIYNQLKGVLTDAGLEEIDATNQPFDPTWHEAMAQQTSADVPEGHVLQQLRKGYKLRERLVRPASVIVAKKASE